MDESRECWLHASVLSMMQGKASTATKANHKRHGKIHCYKHKYFQNVQIFLLGKKNCHNFNTSIKNKRLYSVKWLRYSNDGNYFLSTH